MPAPPTDAAEVGRTPWSAAGPPASLSALPQKSSQAPRGFSSPLIASSGGLWARRIGKPALVGQPILAAAAFQRRAAPGARCIEPMTAPGDRFTENEGVIGAVTGEAARPAQKSRKDSGFALLLVFLMASIIAISLYMELPRVAFQAERQKEQLLMERGEQYKRAIGLFLRTNKNTRWPASIDELESYNNHRSLRRRYIDPMTGKDEWRLIHIQNGVLTDSLTNKKPNSNDQAGLVPTGFINELQGVGMGGSTGTAATNPGLRRRASDGGPSVGPDGQPIQTSSSGTDPNGGASPPTPPPSVPPGSVVPGANGPPSGIAGLMGIPTTAQNGGQTTGPSSGLGSFSGLSGGGLSSQPAVPGAMPQGFPGGSVIPGANGAGNGQPGGVQINQAAQSAAAGLLQNLLTQPRPGGLSGVTSSTIGGAGGVPGAAGAIMGSGIAGVASKVVGESIMVYGQKTDFSEWEFLYDPMKFHVPNPNGNAATGIGTPVAQIGSTAGMSNPGTPIGTGPGGNQPSSFGASGAQSSSFGSPSGPGGLGGSSSGFGSSGAPGGGSAGFGASTGGFGGSSTSGTSGTGSSGAPGATGATSSNGTAFGQAGLPDIRPGKK
jgi:hypothetical protein